MLRLLTLTTMLVAPLGAAMMLATSEYGTGKSAFSDWWQAQTRAARIHEDRITLDQSQEAANAIASELLEGRLSLREAANAMYAEMERWIPDTRDFQESYSARIPEEAILCWAVRYAEAQLVLDSQRREVLRRLRTELRQFRSGFTFR